VPLPPAAAGVAAHRAAHRDVAAEPAEADAAGLTSFSIGAASAPASAAAAAAQPGAQSAPAAAAAESLPVCPLLLADDSASDLFVPYAGGWLKGVDFGCSHEAPPGVPRTKMTGTPAFMVRR